MRVRPRRVSDGAVLALAASGAPDWAAVATGLLALTLVGRVLWSSARLSEAAGRRQVGRVEHRVLDAWPATATASRFVTRDERIPVAEHVEPRGGAAAGSVLDLHLHLPPGLTADDVEAASARLAVALGAAREALKLIRWQPPRSS